MTEILDGDSHSFFVNKGQEFRILLTHITIKDPIWDDDHYEVVYMQQNDDSTKKLVE
jgi:hypothetical protein